MNTPRIVIVGAGFAGLLSAKRLAQKLKGKIEVVLINQRKTFVFAPRLIDVLQYGFERIPIQADLAALSKKYGFTFIQATVQSVDRTARRVSFQNADGATEELEYTYAVISQGATTNYYHTPGAEEFTIDLKSVENVYAIQKRVADLFERAKAAATDLERQKLLSFAVIGAGAAGIEAIFALRVYAQRYADEHSPELKKFLSFIIDQAAPQILPGFPAALVDGASMEILRHGVSVFIGEPVVRVTADGFETLHGRMVPAGVMIWCAGLAAKPLNITPAPAVDPAGFIVTDQSLRIDEHLFAAGDAISMRDNHVIVPKNGQTARLMAFTIEKNIRRALVKQLPVPFHYSSKGTLLIVGNMGFLDLRILVLRSRFILPLRDFFYRMIYTEIAT